MFSWKNYASLYHYSFFCWHLHYNASICWITIEEIFQEKLSRCKGKLLSLGGRLVLINSVLTSLAMYMLSFFEVPKGVLQKNGFLRVKIFFGNMMSTRKKNILTKWSILCRPKDFGGLGIQNLDIQNKCLLNKWLFKLLNWLMRTVHGKAFWKNTCQLK
jgi:hypothetical protein